MSTRPPYVVNMSAVDVKDREAFQEHLLSSCLREEVANLLCRALDARKPEPAAKSSGSDPADPDGAKGAGYPSSTGSQGRAEFRMLYESFRKLRGNLFWGPYNKDPTVWGTTVGSPMPETPL